MQRGTRSRYVLRLAAYLTLAVFALVWAGTASAQQTHNPLPTAGSSFLSALNTYLLNEDAARFVDMFQNFVVSGGVLTPVGGLTGTPTALTAYAAGFYLTESGSVTFQNNTTCWLIASWQTSGNLTSFVRVAGTHYLTDCTSVSQPTQPSAAAYIAQVQTSAGAITVVTDLRTTSPVTFTSILAGPYVVGDLLYANSTTTFTRLPDVASGSVLRSGGVGVAPLYGKVRLDADVSGVLGNSNGGLGASSGANGAIPIGTGTGFSIATITAGTNVTVTNTAGGITIAAPGAISTGFRCLSVVSPTATTVPFKGCPNTPSRLMALEVAGSILTGTPTSLSTASDIRALTAGSGSITVGSGSRTLTFSVSQTLLQGDTVKTQGGKLFTVRTGSGTSWTAYQPAAGNEGPVSFTVSNSSADPGTTRPGGSVPVPDALLFAYGYATGIGGLGLYLDTSIPTANGYHPYNVNDRWTGYQIYALPTTGNLDTGYLWTQGLTQVILGGSAGGDYATSAAAFSFVDATNLRRPFFLPSSAVARTFSSFQVLAAAVGSAQVEFGFAADPVAVPAALSNWTNMNGAAVNELHTVTDWWAAHPADDVIVFLGLIFRGDGANPVTLANAVATADGTGRSPRVPRLQLQVAE